MNRRQKRASLSNRNKPFGDIVMKFVREGRTYQYHATKGWRNNRFDMENDSDLQNRDPYSEKEAFRV